MVSQPKPPKAEHSRFSPMIDNCYRRGPLRVLTILVSMSYSCLRHERLQSHPTKVGRYIVLYLLSTSSPFIVPLSSLCRPKVNKLSSVLVIIVRLTSFCHRFIASYLSVYRRFLHLSPDIAFHGPTVNFSAIHCSTFQ